MQAVPLGFMRGIVGALGIGSAYMMGRSIALLRRGHVRISRVYGWAIRTMLCLLAAWYPARPDVDTSDLLVWSLSAAALAIAWWDASRAKKPEEVKLGLMVDSEDDTGDSPPKA